MKKMTIISSKNLNLRRMMTKSIRKCRSEYIRSTLYKGITTRYREAQRVLTEARYSILKMG